MKGHNTYESFFVSPNRPNQVGFQGIVKHVLDFSVIDKQHGGRLDFPPMALVEFAVNYRIVRVRRRQTLHDLQQEEARQCTRQPEKSIGTFAFGIAALTDFVRNVLADAFSLSCISQG